MCRFGCSRQCRAGFSLSELLVVMAATILLVAIALPLLAATVSGMGTAGSKRNLMQLAMAHQMYGADYNGNQWVNVPHDIASYGDTVGEALANYAAVHSDSPDVMFGMLVTWLGWATNPSTDGVGLWYYAYPGYNLPINLDDSWTMLGFGYYRMHYVRSFNQYVGGKVYDETYFAPKHSVAQAAVGDCFADPYEFCMNEGNEGFTYWPSYSFSPAALFHPDLWTLPNGEFPESTDAIVAEFDHAFEVLPYSAAKYPDLKTHIAEHVWLQNNTFGSCHDAYPGGPGDYDGCESPPFNASIHSAPVTLFYDGHVRLLPLTEVKAADEKIGVWRRDTPMGETGYFQEFGVEGQDNPELSHHILTDGGTLGRDTLGK